MIASSCVFCCQAKRRATKIIKLRAQAYGLDKPLRDLLVTDILAAERRYWESYAQFAEPKEMTLLPVVLPVQGSRWENEVVKIPTKSIRRMRHVLGAFDGGYTEVKVSTIGGYGLFATKKFIR